MTEGPFEAKYNLVINEIARKLKEDPRIKEIQPWATVERGSPTEAPRHYPVIYLAEGQITDIVWDTGDALMTVVCAIEIYIQSRTREEGIKMIRNRTLKVFDTLVGTIADRRLDVAGVSLANGENGVKITNCEFGYFSPGENNIVYKAMLEIAINVEVPLT